MIVDAYAHCAVEKYLPIEALESSMVKSGVDACLLVQHMGQFDNGYLASILRRWPEKYRAICLVDTSRHDAAVRLENLLAGQGAEADGATFVGARMSADMVPQQPACLQVLNRYSATLVLYLPDGIGLHLDLFGQLARDFPAVTLYVPHLGWPIVEGKPSPRWHDAITYLRQFSQVIVGLSAIYYYSWQPFPHEDVWPYLKHILAQIGADRTLWGSDFPLLLDTETVTDSLNLFAGSQLGIEVHQRESILGRTAGLCYGFDQP